MTRSHRISLFTAVALPIVLSLAALSQATDESSLQSPRYDSAFWSHWGDGQAELAGYDLKSSRYGELREGNAVTIFVTETFSDEARVKADPGKHAKSDEFPVIKLNLAQDFPTGVYDYNMMTSVFVQLTGRNDRPAGTPTKVSFSAQEWCGHVYHQLLFDDDGIRSTKHSYFDGEADRAYTEKYPGGAITEDALLFWARGLAAPRMTPGTTYSGPMLRSVQYSRLRHRPLTWTTVELSVATETSSVTVPAGEFVVVERTAKIKGGPTWTFHVENAAPHRLIKWENSEGESAELLGSDRMKYWQMNRNGYEKALERIGMKPRPQRMP